MKKLIPLFLLASLFALSAQAETIIEGSSLFGGIVKNRRTGDRIGLKCLPSNEQCDKVNVLLLQKKGSNKYIVMKTIRTTTLGNISTIATNLASVIRDRREFDSTYLPDSWDSAYFYQGTVAYMENVYDYDSTTALQIIGSIGLPIVAGVDTVITAGLNALLLTRLTLLGAEHLMIEVPRTALMVKRTGKALRYLVSGRAGKTMSLNNLKFELVVGALTSY